MARKEEEVQLLEGKGQKRHKYHKLKAVDDSAFYESMHLEEGRKEDKKAIRLARFFMFYAYVHLIIQIVFLVLYYTGANSSFPYKVLNLSAQSFFVVMQGTFLIIFCNAAHETAASTWIGTTLGWLGNVLFLLFAISRILTHHAAIWEPEDPRANHPIHFYHTSYSKTVEQVICTVGGVFFVLCTGLFTWISIPGLSKATQLYGRWYEPITNVMPLFWRRERGPYIGNLLFFIACILWLWDTYRWVKPEIFGLPPLTTPEEKAKRQAFSIWFSRVVAVVATALSAAARMFLMWSSSSDHCDLLFRAKKHSKWDVVRKHFGPTGKIPISLATPFYAGMFR